MKTNKLELDNVVKVTYLPEKDKHKFSTTFLTAMVAVPEESLPPMSEEEKKRGRLLQVYFDKAVEILSNEMGPIHIYSIVSRFVGDMTVIY